MWRIDVMATLGNIATRHWYAYCQMFIIEVMNAGKVMCPLAKLPESCGYSTHRYVGGFNIEILLSQVSEIIFLN